jgi:predicted naringenin-chalcone synthase
MASRIISIGTASPEHAATQEEILGFMQKAYENSSGFRKLKILSHHSGIDTRYSVLPDFGAGLSPQFFRHGDRQPDVGSRMDIFKDHAMDLAIRSAKNGLMQAGMSADEITHIISVTCTGLHAPGLSAEIIKAMGLKDDIPHTAVNFMGCNAAFYALKIADLIASQDADARVLIVAVELCTLHFQPKDNNDSLLSNTLFGDGAASVVVAPDHVSLPGLDIEGFYSLVLNRGKELMGWDVNPLSFEMVLSNQVPDFIGEEVEDVVSRAARHYGIGTDDIIHWAIHPGGKRILDEIAKNLDMPKEKLHNGYEVLRNYGNMSSPTILYVLKRFMDAPATKGEKLFSVGFGPGLSIETALLSYA